MAAGDGGDGDTQALEDSGTPPPGSPFSDGNATQIEGDDDDGVLYGETQALDDDETQAIDDDGLEEEEGMGRDWVETQVVEDSGEDEEEEEGAGVGEDTMAHTVEDCREECSGEQAKTRMVTECEKEGDGGGLGGQAGDYPNTQLDEDCEVEDGGGDGVGDGLETQVEECQEEERVDDSGAEDAVELVNTQLWGETQLVEDAYEESGDDGEDNLSDDEGLGNDEKDGDDIKNLVDSDASTDEEDGTASVRVAPVQTFEFAAAREAFTVDSVQQGEPRASSNETHLLAKDVDNATLCSTSFGDRPDSGIDNDSHGYAPNHDKDGSKSKGKCSTAKKLFADTTPKKSERNTKLFSGLSYTGSQEPGDPSHLSGLSYIGSQDPGDMSQANALEVVEGLISMNGGLSSQEPTPKKSETAKPLVSIKRGTLRLAEKVDLVRSSNGKSEIFAWVDSREDDGGGDFFSKNKDILLDKSAVKGKSKIPKAKKCATKIARTENKIGGCKTRSNSKLCGRVETLPLSDSGLLKCDVKSKRTSRNRTKKNLLNDLHDMSNAKPLEGQQEKVSAGSHDIGPDTQMALEAIEELAQCSPAKIFSPARDRKSKVVKSQSENSHARKRTSSIQEGSTTRSKRIKLSELKTKPQKERKRGTKVQKVSEESRTDTKHKQAKSVPKKSKAPKIFPDGNMCDGTHIARRTRHASRNNSCAYTELCPNKRLKGGTNLTGEISTIGENQNKHITTEPERVMVNERTTESGSEYVEKESIDQTCVNDAQNVHKYVDGSVHHASANNAQSLEPLRDESTTHVACGGSSHPKQRRTPTAMVQTNAQAVAQTVPDHGIQPEVVRPSKKRRVFITSVSAQLKYAKRETSNGSNSGQRQKEPCNVGDTSTSPKSNSGVQSSSALKTPSKVVNELSPTFSPLNPSKSSSRSLSKASVARELLKLDPENALSNGRLKDSRRKDMTGSSILFSHHLGDDVIKRQKKILARLGVREAFFISDATHFVADSFFRTKNMLEAITLGKVVVTSKWLESCGQAGCFVNDKKYILRDVEKEKELGFNMPISLASARKHPLLQGKRVFVTPDVKPSREVVTSLVSASSGQPLERIGRSVMKEKKAPDDLLVISCEEDYETCARLLEKGAGVFSSELLLNGIIIQKLEYDRHRLFADRVKQTRSTRWLKDTAGCRFLPVSKS